MSNNGFKTDATIHCFNCNTFLASNSTRFFLTHCKHVFCLRCVKKMNTQCVVCKAELQIIEIKNKMPDAYKNLVVDFQTFVAERRSSFLEKVNFERAQWPLTIKLVADLKQKNDKLEEQVQEMEKDVTKWEEKSKGIEEQLDFMIRRFGSPTHFREGAMTMDGHLAGRPSKRPRYTEVDQRFPPSKMPIRDRNAPVIMISEAGPFRQPKRPAQMSIRNAQISRPNTLTPFGRTPIRVENSIRTPFGRTPIRVENAPFPVRNRPILLQQQSIPFREPPFPLRNPPSQFQDPPIRFQQPPTRFRTPVMPVERARNSVRYAAFPIGNRPVPLRDTPVPRQNPPNPSPLQLHVSLTGPSGGRRSGGLY